jgi:hypothetical protein
MRRTEFGRGVQRGRRVQLYLELRDLWAGAYLAPGVIYLGLFGLVLRIEWGGR